MLIQGKVARSILVPEFSNGRHTNVQDAVFGKDFAPNPVGPFLYTANHLGRYGLTATHATSNENRIGHYFVGAYP